MFIIFGTRWCGSVDRVPGRYYVATQCFHIFFLPLLPLGSYVTFEDAGRSGSVGWPGLFWVRRTSRRVVPIDLSIRSWLTAWARVVMTPVLVALALSTSTVVIRQPAEPPLVVALGLGSAAVSVVALAMLLIPNTASPRRVEQLQRYLRAKGAPDPRQDQLLAVALRPKPTAHPPVYDASSPDRSMRVTDRTGG